LIIGFLFGILLVSELRKKGENLIMKAEKTTKTKKVSLNIMDSLLKKTKPTLLRKGKEIEAKITSISKKGIVFDVGGKAQAILGELEIKEISTYIPYLNVGDKILVRIISEESKNGFPVVSLRKFFDKGKWDILIKKRDNEEEIDVMCGEYGKGGIFINFMGIRGVIPKIQLTEPYISQPEKMRGQKVKVKILEVDKEKNRLVVSQKASVLKISHKDLVKKFEAIKEGKVYKAKVLGASEFGVFCEVEGVEGLIHISEISWEKVSNAASFVTVGETIDVYVVEKNMADFKLNLSLKRLQKDPWEIIEEKYPKDKEVEGEVTRKEKYGYFVKLEPGIEGLIHISKLKGDEDLKIGQKIKAFIERVSKKERRMSLVLPQTEKPVMYR
jgi:ribosomal protein S1